MCVDAWVDWVVLMREGSGGVRSVRAARERISW